MPPSRRNRPALERAVPGPPGSTTGYRRDRTGWWMIFGDGEWHWVTVRAWWTDRHGQDVVQIEWYADGGAWGDTFVLEADKIRPFEEPGDDREDREIE